MLRELTRAISLALLAAAVGCGPPFKPTYKHSLDCFRHPESVPIIAVAKIEPKAETFVGGPYKVNLSVGPVLLYKVRLTIENVIQGSVPLGHVDMFAYASMTISPGDIGFSGSNGFRDIVLLRRERGKLRVVEDIDSNCNAPLYSGAHPRFKPHVGEPVSEQMIDLLLTPGIGATDLGMIQASFDFTPPEISPDYTAKTLLKLATLPSPVIRTAACLQFRDLLAEKGPALSDRFSVSRSDLKRWQAQEEQNYPAKFWWGHGPLSYTVPKAPLPAGNLTGMNLAQTTKPSECRRFGRQASQSKTRCCLPR